MPGENTKRAAGVLVAAQQRYSRTTEPVNKPSTQVRRLLASAVAALLRSALTSLKDHAQVVREVRSADQPAYEPAGPVGPNPKPRGLHRLAIEQAE